LSDAPDRCDVAVLGDGIAGLLTAHALADAADVVIVAPKAPPRPATASALGIVASGGIDSPARLAVALGEPAARAFWTWSADATARLLSLAAGMGVEASVTGSWRLAMGEVEAAEWEASLGLLRRWLGEGAARPATGDERDRLGRGFDRAVRVAGDGVLDVAELSDALRSGLSDRVAAVESPARIDGIGADGVELLLDGGDRLRAELVVVAAGAGCGSVHPWFGPTLFPVRLQALRTAPLAGPIDPAPRLARHRFEAWRQLADGGLAFTGSRWAEQPEMEAGVTDDASISDRVDVAQRAFVGRHLPDAAGAEAVERWTGIEAFCCDGLPLVGSLPGMPRVLALTGWGGWGLSMVARAVDDVCGAILARTDAAPLALLAPRRMV
jgi:glycine/D-amino acid oxidase-like deaminating enzyme